MYVGEVNPEQRGETMRMVIEVIGILVSLYLIVVLNRVLDANKNKGE